jgi:hypothetical protein
MGEASGIGQAHMRMACATKIQAREPTWGFRARENSTIPPLRAPNWQQDSSRLPLASQEERGREAVISITISSTWRINRTAGSARPEGPKAA